MYESKFVFSFSWASRVFERTWFKSVRPIVIYVLSRLCRVHSPSISFSLVPPSRYAPRWHENTVSVIHRERIFLAAMFWRWYARVHTPNRLFIRPYFFANARVSQPVVAFGPFSIVSFAQTFFLFPRSVLPTRFVLFGQPRRTVLSPPLLQTKWCGLWYRQSFLFVKEKNIIIIIINKQIVNLYFRRPRTRIKSRRTKSTRASTHFRSIVVYCPHSADRSTPKCVRNYVDNRIP